MGENASVVARACTIMQEAARACLLDILAAVEHGYLPEDLVTLAGIGCTGHLPKNAKRDAERRLLQDQ